MKTAVRYEFHISRQARDRYEFDDSLFAFNGNVVFDNFHAVRQFAQKMNDRRDLLNFPERVVRAGQLNAMGLIDEIMHVVVDLYRQQVQPQVMADALAWLQRDLEPAVVAQTLRQFAEEFPLTAVYRGEISLADYLAGESQRPNGQTVSNQAIVLEELLLLWVANQNPAFQPFSELFNDEGLTQNSAYAPLIKSLYQYFATQPPFGPENQNLIDMLRAPAVAVPDSLTGQLEYIRTRWSFLIGQYLFRLLSSLDLVKEEEKATLFGAGGRFQGAGPGPAVVVEFTGQEAEVERFSPDRDWMPNLVLIAKNSYVWLDQLSKRYKRAITRLDQIPDEELDNLARWGISGLWLIGLWERSSASRRIKQMRGNPDAVASAYSLYSYEIAADLGGDSAYRTLRDRAWQRGIRLASDMVPNHMGIDSRWVIEHPEWFVSLDYSPFPSYTFNGSNLSWDGRVQLFLEDHYFNNTDAAVVFKRVDSATGQTQYIYHGNDGTSMPWNDTAQLNYLNPAVREAVIQTILEVARKFPVIRFDAAMTLAKRHYQRLWYPEPGSGGDIPSRAEHGLTKEQFDAAMPEEFWREVVDRVAQEVPDTLLLAEAFWMMEGYFVRTLGMHRVYNSAFMNMLRDEKNQEYRLAIKNTLEFDPEILKRYVNFMNNPDERTAVDQFGKGDKYFGVFTLMATMPGLPMIGHGQVEGFTEKYGMEYQRAYWDERPDGYLVERHEREVFPLLRRRYLFAGVQDFLLYDFFTPDGGVNEDVFAYSNRDGQERALVLYHNKFASARGWVRTSVAYMQKSEGRLVQRTLGAGLGLHDDPSYYTIFRDHLTGLEYIRSSQELCQMGLYAELDAYKVQVFLDFRETVDNEWRQYAYLTAALQGRGVPSVEEALREVFLQPLHTPFREIFNAGMLTWLIENRAAAEIPATQPQALDEATTKYARLMLALQELMRAAHHPIDGQGAEVLAAHLRAELSALLNLALPPAATAAQLPQVRAALLPLQSDDPALWSPLLAWVFTHRLGAAESPVDSGPRSRAWLDEFLLNRLIVEALRELGLSEAEAWRAAHLGRILITVQDWLDPSLTAAELALTCWNRWLKNAEVQQLLGVNRYQGVLWFNQEALDELTMWLARLAALQISLSGDDGAARRAQAEAVLELWQRAAQLSNFQVDKLTTVLENAAEKYRRPGA